MDYFDLHCDTIPECLSMRQGLYSNSLAVSLDKAKTLSRYIQIFALFIRDRDKGKRAKDYYKSCLDFYLQELEKNKENITPITSADELSQVKHGAILSVEGAGFVESLTDIEEASGDGVRLITLTWNGKNKIGCGVRYEEGLTEFGKSAVVHMQKCGIIVDVSHLSDQGFFDVLSVTRAPIVASHSNSRTLRNVRRNLTDEQAREIIGTGGLIGINFYTKFLARTNSGLEDIVRHTEHFLSLSGEDCVAMGSDFDGAKIPEEVDRIDKIGIIEERFQKEFGEGLTRKLLFENAYRFFEKQLG